MCIVLYNILPCDEYSSVIVMWVAVIILVLIPLPDAEVSEGAGSI